MVLHVPFLRWDGIGNPSASSSGTAFYYLETAARKQVITALTLRTEDNRLIYHASFALALCVFSVCAYRELWDHSFFLVSFISKVFHILNYKPVIKQPTVIVLLSLALHFARPIKQLHISNAFLHSSLQQKIYIRQPQGLIDNQNSLAHSSLFILRKDPHSVNVLVCAKVSDWNMNIRSESIFFYICLESLDFWSATRSWF